MAIRQNTHSLNAMQQAILASLYHCKSTDENPNHHLCPSGPESWCKWQADPATYKHKKGLPQCIIDLIEPIYEDLSRPELLAKCLHGKTQNPNEALNKLIWDRCGKMVWVSRKVAQDATNKAISHFNDGKISLLRLLRCLGVDPGPFTVESVMKSDRARMYHASRKESVDGKCRRKVLRAMRKGKNDSKLEEEGTTYETSGF